MIVSMEGRIVEETTVAVNTAKGQGAGDETTGGFRVAHARELGTLLVIYSAHASPSNDLQMISILFLFCLTPMP